MRRLRPLLHLPVRRHDQPGVLTVDQQPAQPLTDRIAQALRIVDAIQEERDQQPRTFHANGNLHAPRLLDIAQALRAELAARDAENTRLREQLAAADEATNEAMLHNDATCETVKQRDILADVNINLNRVNARLRKTNSNLRAAHESTVLEAQRQAKRADTAEARAEGTIALAHSWLYHQGHPCPTPGDCVGGAPDPVRPCGCPRRFGRHADGCPEQTPTPAPAARPAD